MERKGGEGRVPKGLSPHPKPQWIGQKASTIPNESEMSVGQTPG